MAQWLGECTAPAKDLNLFLAFIDTCTHMHIPICMNRHGTQTHTHVIKLIF